MNLVDLVKKQLNSDVMGKFAEILGTNPQATRDAANAVVPTLLATVGGLTSTRDGAGKLSSTLSGLDENVLGNFARSLTGSQSVVDTGTTLLGSLFENEALSGLLTAQVSDFFRSATDVLTDMKDAASAQAALPKLKDLTAKLDALRGSIDQLPADAKEKVLTVFKGLSSKLVQLMDKVMATPGVGETIRPIMEELQGKLIALTGV
jgi:hypothetical protein